jgi:hypothetical protein
MTGVFVKYLLEFFGSQTIETISINTPNSLFIHCRTFVTFSRREAGKNRQRILQFPAMLKNHIP